MCERGPWGGQGATNLLLPRFFPSFGNVYKNSELAFSAVDKEKADKKEIKYL